MSQLSSFSQNTINKIRLLLAQIENILRLLRKLIFKKIPHFIANLLYSLQALKDISSFIPSYIYKLILALIIFALVRARARRYLNSLQHKEQRVIQTPTANHLSKSQIFNDLGQQFEVKEKISVTKVCEAIEQDSCCVDLNEQLEKQPQDFRDIVFFQLMRGYQRSFSNQSRFCQSKIEKI